MTGKDFGGFRSQFTAQQRCIGTGDDQLKPILQLLAHTPFPSIQYLYFIKIERSAPSVCYDIIKPGKVISIQIKQARILKVKIKGVLGKVCDRQHADKPAAVMGKTSGK